MKKYKEEYLPHNYSVHIGDIAGSVLAKKWQGELSPTQLDAVLYMFGIDIDRFNTKEDLDKDTTMRSPITGDVVVGGFLHVGYERTDETWKKHGLRNLQKYLFTEEGCDEFIKVLKGEEVESGS